MTDSWGRTPNPVETDAEYGPFELGYTCVGPGSDWFATWRLGGSAPRRGYKLHVSPLPDDAEAVAQCVLHRLRACRCPHKVVRDHKRYCDFNADSDQCGKFITIYTPTPYAGNTVLRLIDPPLLRLVQMGVIHRTPFSMIPTTRASNHQEAEHAISQSGLVFVRYFEDDDPDVA